MQNETGTSRIGAETKPNQTTREPEITRYAQEAAQK